MVSMDSSILVVDRVCVNINGKEILRDISLNIMKGQQWAIYGEAGSGKTVFAQTLAGNYAFKGSIEFPLAEVSNQEKKVMVVELKHRFRDLQNQSNFYYQQRYNAIDAEATITVEEYLLHLRESEFGNLSKAELLELFGLSRLMKEPLIQLSNGENKRLQILKAILSFHQILILDEPYTGLDKEGRKLLDNIISILVDSGQHFILLDSRGDVPSCFNRFARLIEGKLEQISELENEQLNLKPTAPEAVREFPSAISFSFPDFDCAVRMRQVSVQYEGKKILEEINWVVERGSCWALTGENGAGKSTLLSLITADNPQAYANDIYLFDRKRGTGESIWEIKQKIGFLSPELQLYFDETCTAFNAIASGLFDTIGLFRQLTPLQEKLVSEWLEYLGCTPYSNRLLSSLPGGIQRLILLGRALIKTPPLLVLDEPCQGLDKAQTIFTLQTIDRFCAHFHSTLIFVSHYSQDFPACITQIMELTKGRQSNLLIIN
jgi:molybdate transport system ATP-binding protein